MSKYVVYPAVFERSEDGGVSAWFPDFVGAAVIGKDVEDAAARAEELLAFRVWELVSEGNVLPEPTRFWTVEEGEFVRQIAAERGVPLH